MAAPPRAREVSCLALTFFYDYLEERGIPRRRLQEGLAYTPEHLDARINWIDYATFVEIERRMAVLVPEPELFFHIGLSFAATRGFGFLRVIFRSVLTPAQLYLQLTRLVKRFLFPFVDIEMTRGAHPGAIRMTYRFADRFVPTSAYLDTVRGILTGIPAMMGLPSADVSMTRTGEREAVFEVALQGRRRRGLWTPVEFGRRIVHTARMWVRNRRDLPGELEETNRLLQEQVDALTEAKAELDRRVRQLSILNTVSRVATSDLDLGRVLQGVATVLSEELGGLAVAVLLAEGEPRRLVLAASVQLTREIEDALNGRHFDDMIEHPAPRIVEAGDRHLRALPMLSRDRVVAALVVCDAAEEEHALLESVASQLAVIVENVIAYQTITDLRDHLEVRVRERTAELEDARAQLEDTVERLKRSDRARTDFFTNVSHELRTPLTLVLAPLDAVEAALAGAPPDVQANLRLIRENAQALLRMINEILDFARLDAERMPVRPRPVELGALVDEVVATLRPLADRRGVRLAWTRPEVACEATVDPKLVRRALANIVTNGIKYVASGNAVAVALRGTGDEVLLEVTDDGPGIPREYHARVFERFQRVPDASGRIIEGSGIGLAMVKEIVQLHGGTIALESEAGLGARFTVRLPREGTRAHAAAEPAAGLPDELSAIDAPVQTVQVAAPEPARAAAGSRVLLVEDNPEMRGFLLRLLGAHYRVEVAIDGLDALEKVRASLPDGIVSDVMMPRLDGLELCRRLKADRLARHVPVVLVSARHGAEAALEGFAAGADDYVVKPFSAPELLARVDAQLRIRRLALTVMRMEKQTTLGLMAAGIAHEVLNPVNAVANAVPPLRSALARIGQDKEASALALALLDSIERSSARIRRVVDAMLALSRQAPDELRMREVRLSDGIEATLAVLQFRISDGVTIHREFEWDGVAWCHPDLVNQVVMNLLVNALDSVDPRRGNVWVRLLRAGDEIRLEVEDDGPGVPRELREHVFEPFFTTKPPGAGTGLGLAVSREIADLHAGSLELTEAPGGGARFVLKLPATEPTRLRAAPAVLFGGSP